MPVKISAASYDAYNSACAAVKLLVIHALRTVAVAAKTWEELRENALSRADRTIQWIKPENPVIPAINMGRTAFLDLRKPAGTHQVIATLNTMPRQAKTVVRLRVHDLRHGAARDLAHLDQRKLRGNTSMQVAGALGHRMSTMMHDVTEMYVGGSDISTWNLRAESQWADSRAPRIGNTVFVPRPIPQYELQRYCLDMGWDPSKGSNLRNARLYICWVPRAVKVKERKKISQGSSVKRMFENMVLEKKINSEKRIKKGV